MSDSEVGRREFKTLEYGTDIESGGEARLMINEDGERLVIRHNAPGSQLMGTMKPDNWPAIRDAVERLFGECLKDEQ